MTTAGKPIALWPNNHNNVYASSLPPGGGSAPRARSEPDRQQPSHVNDTRFFLSPWLPRGRGGSLEERLAPVPVRAP